jgi:hypothetical protein
MGRITAVSGTGIGGVPRGFGLYSRAEVHCPSWIRARVVFQSVLLSGSRWFVRAVVAEWLRIIGPED